MNKNANTTRIQPLDADMLEKVSGGVLTEQTETTLNMTLTDYKKQCHTKAEVVDMLKMNYADSELARIGITLEEACTYADDYYDFY